MSIPQQSHLRDVALAAIAQAHRQIGAGENLVQVDETALKLEEEKIATRHPSDEQPRFAEPGRGSSRGRLVLGSLMGLLAVACIGVAAFAWPSPHGQAAPEPISIHRCRSRKRNYRHSRPHLTPAWRPRRMQDFRNDQVRLRPRSNAKLQKLGAPLQWLPI